MPHISPTPHLDGPILLVGAGKMGHALIAGWIGKGVIEPKGIFIYDPYLSDDEINGLNNLGISWEGPFAYCQSPSVIIMAVKPQIMDTVFPGFAREKIAPHTIVLSIAAGKTLASFEQHLPQNAPVVRAMPNTPAAIGRGMTVLCANGHVTPSQRTLCNKLMSAVGEVGWVEDEALMDAVTAVSGSGPAYVFLLAETLAAAGIKAGLDPLLAVQLARATIAGSGELMFQSLDPAATLRQNVTSPGGTTAAALEVLMANDGLAPLMDRAIAAAVTRGRALSK